MIQAGERGRCAGGEVFGVCITQGITRQMYVLSKHFHIPSHDVINSVRDADCLTFTLCGME